MRKNRKYAGPRLLVILTLLAVSLISCATKPPVYVRGDSQVIELKTGDPAPAEGYFISPAALVDLMECCQDKL